VMFLELNLTDSDRFRIRRKPTKTESVLSDASIDCDQLGRPEAHKSSDRRQVSAGFFSWFHRHYLRTIIISKIYWYWGLPVSVTGKSICLWYIISEQFPQKTKALLLVMVCDYICLRTFVSCWIWSSRCKCLRLSLACRREHQYGILDSMVLQLSCRSWLPPLLCQTWRSLRAHAWADSFWSAPAQTFKHEVPNTSYC